MERKDAFLWLYSLARALAEAHSKGLISDDDFKTMSEAIHRSIQQLWKGKP